VLVAVGISVIVILTVIFLNSLIWFNLNVAASPVVTSLLETQKSFLIIIGTAFASLVAFYFGTRGTQRGDAETVPSTTVNGSQKALEVNDINPIDGSAGIEINTPITATFSSPVRSSTNNPNTFFVKDEGNPVEGKYTLADNNTTVRFNPVSSLNRGRRHTVNITKGIKDISGAPLIAGKEWHFTTEQ
jgi:hypothetical protein